MPTQTRKTKAYRHTEVIKMVLDKRVQVRLPDDFNVYSVNIVKNNYGVKANILGNKGLNDQKLVQVIIKSYQTHPSIKAYE